jgi:hypothetical protein
LFERAGSLLRCFGLASGGLDDFIMAGGGLSAEPFGLHPGRSGHIFGFASAGRGQAMSFALGLTEDAEGISFGGIDQPAGF